MDSCDVVVVGGGIGGSALAAALAGDGLDVVVLEASVEYLDRVRGESMMPWGVAEARALGLEHALVDAGAHRAGTWLHYDADVPLEVTNANPIPVGFFVPGVDGSLNLRHPEACATLAAAAMSAGACLHRGVSEVKVRLGASPAVSFVQADGRAAEIDAQLVVGADGRRSTVRAAAGLELQRLEETHLIAGLLLEGLSDLPDDSDFLGSEGDLFMASFWQGDGRLRVYLCPGLAQRHRFSGPGGLDEFMRSTAFGCLPFGDELARATPSGPLATYPGDDTWMEEPYADGVVLIGDAAGYNNPVIGQGLSIAMRDARSVRDAIRVGGTSPAAFVDYARERVERMRRLRHIATCMATAMANDGDDRRERRARFFELQQTEPLMLGIMGAAFGGPETGPPEAFDGRILAALRGSAVA